MIIDPQGIPERISTGYPAPFRALVAGRARRRIGEAAGLTNFGVNVTRLAPGSSSALRHWHSRQDEFIYVLEGELTLITNAGEQILKPGMCAGFPAGEADGHCLVNRTDRDVTYLEVGDRTSGDSVTYPDVDLLAQENAGTFIFTHKDGSPYESP